MKNYFLWIQTPDEQRAEKIVIQAAAALQFNPLIWTVTNGLRTPTDTKPGQFAGLQPGGFPQLFQGVPNNGNRETIIIKDAAPYLEAPVIRRAIRDEIQTGRRRDSKTAHAFIFIDTAPAPTIPGIVVIELPLPDRNEIARIVDFAIQAAPQEIQQDADTNGNRAAIAAALIGLDTDQIRSALNRSRIQTGLYKPEFLAQEKKALVKSDVVEWIEPNPAGLDAIGGLDVMKEDLVLAKVAFTQDAADYGIKPPRGTLVVGIPGSGKSLSAVCIATAFKIPLLKINLSAAFGKFLGESEKATRAALATAEAVAPCVVWLDELEKALAGGAGGGDADGGAAVRVFGIVLEWMQERKKPVYVFATANKIENLPPELKRAGRFDSIYFVDVPTRKERIQIAQIMNSKFKPCGNVQTDTVADATAKFTGAEIEEAYSRAMLIAYKDGRRPVTAADVARAAAGVIPIAVSEAKTLDALRTWAATAARAANRPEANETQQGSDFSIE